MHLGDAPAVSTLHLEQVVGEALDHRLLKGGPRPVAVALSGGGDSLALLLAAAVWAKAATRTLLVLTVDHQLRPESARWTDACATTATRLGLTFRALAWTGEKPGTGLPAAARAARHALLADAAREAGARVILMGHTADDILEAGAMRQAGSTTTDPREWSPSPAWPQGRGLFVLRPMLEVRRRDIRGWLAARGERWIDDPANEDMSYARPRARQAIAKGVPASVGKPAPSAKALAQASRPEPGAGFEIGRAELRVAAPEALTRFVSAACLCAAGTQRPPARDRVERLAARLRDTSPFVASLAGARIEADATLVRFLREAGEASRGGLAPLSLRAGETGVWDGRFEVTSERAGQVQAAPRSTLPVAIGEDGAPQDLRVASLTLDRLFAACGAVEVEPA